MSDGRRRALIIAAHPDDAEWGCAGTTALLAQDGWEVFYTICTSGEQGTEDPEEDEEALKQRREAEQRAAAEVLGVRDVTFLRFPDGVLENTLALRRELVRVIRHYRPALLFCHDPQFLAGDGWVNHPDHRYAGAASLDAVYPGSGNPAAFRDLLRAGLRPHQVEEVRMFYTLDATLWVDIGSVLERKVAALRCHASQIKEPERLEHDVRTFAAQDAAGQGMQYAERFRRVALGA